MSRVESRPIAPVWVFIFFLSVYLLSAGGHYYSPDGETMYSVSRAMLMRGTVALEPASTAGPTTEASIKRGRAVGVTMPGQSIILMPLAAAAELTAGLVPRDKAVYWRRLVTSFTNAFVIAGLLVIFYLMLGRLGYGERVRLLTTGLLGLGTLLWPYAKFDFAEPLLALLLLAAAESVFRYRQGRQMWLAASSSIFLGAATLTKIAGGFLGLPILLYLGAGELSTAVKTGRWRRPLLGIALVAAPQLAAVSMLLYYNWVRFGSPFQLGYLKTPSFANPIIFGLYGLTFSIGKGLVFYSPLAVLFPWALARFWRRHRGEAVVSVLMILLGLLFFASWRDWNGDVAWGPRYLVYLMPFLVLPLAELVKDYGLLPSRGKIVILSVALLALFVQLIGISIFYNAYIGMLNNKYPAELAGGNLSGFRFNPNFAPLTYERKLIAPFFRHWVGNLRHGDYTEVPSGGRELFKWFHRTVPDFWWVYLPLSGLSRNFLAFALVPLIGLAVSVRRLLAAK